MPTTSVLTDTVDCAAGRRLDRGRRLHLRRCAEPVDLLLARAPRRGRDEVDHGHLPRRLDDRQRRRPSANTRARRARTRTPPAPSTRLGRDRRERRASASPRRSTSDTVTAGGASADVHDRRHEQRRLGRRQREPDRQRSTARLLVDSIAAGDYTCARGRASRSPARSRISAAGDTKSITVTYHVGIDHQQRPGRREHGSCVVGRGHRRRRAPTSVAIVEDVDLSVTKAFDSPTVTAGGAAKTFTIDVTNAGVSDADNVVLTDTVDSRLVVDSISGDFTLRHREPDDLLHARAPGRRRHEVDHRHLPRRASTTNSDPAVSNSASAVSDEDAALDSTTRSRS